MEPAMQIDEHDQSSNNHQDHPNRIVRLVLISDTHGHHDMFQQPLPEGDILIHCGDFADRGNVNDARSFAEWFDNQSCCPYKIVIQGNHDRDRRDMTKIDVKSEFAAVDEKIQVLMDETVSCCGLRIHGVSWESCENDDFSQVPEAGIDILLAHINPFLGKSAPIHTRTGWRGSRALARTVLKGRIPLCCSGHVHWARGVVPVQRKSGKYSVFVNASSLKPSGHGVNAPIVMDYDTVEREILRL